jgi:hypothetical protein
LRHPIGKKRFCQSNSSQKQKYGYMSFRSKTQRSLFLASFSLSLFIVSHASSIAANSKLIISEIQCANSDNKFIELYNTSSECIPSEETKKYQLKKIPFGSTAISSIAVLSPSDIPGNDYFLWVKKDDSKYSDLADVSTTATIADNTSIGLFYDGSLIDSIVCGKEKDIFANKNSPLSRNIIKGESILRNINTLSWDISSSPAPRSKEGDVCPPPPPIPPTPPIDASIRINELLPNPSGKDDGEEWVELFNFGSSSTDLTGWILITASGESAKLEKKLPGNNFLSISLPLRNTADTVSLLDPSKTIVSEISYKKAPEGNSLNFSKQGDYRWSNHITKEAENILNKPPETKKTDIPDTAYLDVPVAFSASGRDGDDEKVRYTWDFGDGHKSYKQETTHRYEKKGKYQGVLTISDGTEDAVTEFSLEVKKYEAPKVRMVSLTPNPKGKDSDTENIEIENRSKKSVDLLGWSVATGWKKLINHPIRESFVIEGKSKRFLTRDFSSFTLPNGKGKIEFRSPDGETVQKMKYNLKGKSAEEDARIMKEKGGKWTWVSNQLADNNQQRTDSSRQITEGIQQKAREIENLKEEERLKQDTETITLKKERGEKLVSREKNPKEEMRRLIGFGTDIETPLAILEDIPRVAGTSDDIPRKNTSIHPDDTFDLNAIMNDWLANE